MLIAAYIAAVGLDVATTLVALQTGLREGNPILRLAGRFWLPARLVLAALIAVVAISTGATWTLAFAAMLYAAVAGWNAVQIARAH